MSSPRKQPARDSDVLAFIAAVFPDAPELARLSFDEGHVLRTATSQLALLRDEQARLTKELEEYKALKEDVFDSPAKWMRWCDQKVLERAEAAESSCATLEGQIRDLAKYVAYLKMGYVGLPSWYGQVINALDEKVSALLRSRETIPHPQGDGEASS